MGTHIDNQALEKIPFGVLVFDSRDYNHILFASRRAAQVWDCQDEEELLAYWNAGLSHGIYPGDMDRVFQDISQVSDGEKNEFQITFRILTRKGAMRFVHMSGRREVQDGLIYACVTVHNAEESDVDMLTGLPGPMQFSSHVEALCRNGTEAGKYAVLAFNIERFRLINERFGLREGDLCLKRLAGILTRVFSGGIVCRYAVDTFYVFTQTAHMDDALEIYRELLKKQMSPEWKCVVNIGVFLMPSRELPVGVCMSHAMQACRSLTGTNGKRIAYYDRALEKEIAFARYIEGHLEEAVSRGWIKVYYQPVVRPVNMALCSMEALARWEDPNFGFLVPGQFIPILEEKKQIHKLDRAMISLVCREYEKRVSQGKEVVPVSFNLSRYDFLTGDIVSFIEDEVRTHHVPKDMIHVEITESMMVSEVEVIASAVRRLHEAGYQVWMDDFGSGYSSLNLLKDYDFDKIKLDMKFFSTFTQKSKHIVMTMVRMIKELHSQTLAEGVETAEEFEFLKRIGCERAQGYYIGKPAPYDATLEQVKKLGVQIEPRRIRRFIDKAIKVDFQQDTPLALAELNGQTLTPLYIRQDYKKLLDELCKITGRKLRVEEPSAPWGQTIDFLQTLKQEGSEGVTYMAHGYIYIRLEARVVSVLKGEDRRLYACSLTMVKSRGNRYSQMGEAVARNISQIFRYASIVSVPENKIQVVFNYTGVPEGLLAGTNLSEWTQRGYRRLIHPMDQDRYAAFVDREKLKKALQGRQYVAGLFRTRADDGSYPWRIHIIARFSDPDRQLLYLTSAITFDSQDVVAAMYENSSKGQASNPRDAVLLRAELWDSLVDFMPFKFFWKDREHRFLGASHSFLTYYGVSLKDIVGKKEEEIGNWVIDRRLYIDDEDQCMQEGKAIMNTEGQVTVGGMSRHIYSSKIPVFTNGEVIGLIGYFFSEEEMKAVEAQRQRLLTVDSLTGVMNHNGLAGEVYRFARSYHQLGVDFALADIHIRGMDEIWSSYGERFTQLVVKHITGTLQQVLGNHGELARLSEDQFLAIIHFRKRDEITEWMEKIKEAVWNIHEVDNISITVQAECRGAPFSEQGVEIMWQAIMEGIKRFSADRAEQTLRP
ncbi:diguanylate cyclase (GGDEF) domain-containing protein [Dialister histaminiformans]|uniref:Diguanylate cyclase (GGDEF) domain-containing protein n=1 Tax=Allisonella histaminiformans TaxID=209880 RepID=A0A1G5UW97_9FIRM|nr:EAL domain-containing protein [Allisonella histaminiformans]SDA37903.1 diguanylate cyclase (GGDEF) domain-containing protein [Allisonella histaminiformans]